MANLTRNHFIAAHRNGIGQQATPSSATRGPAFRTAPLPVCPVPPVGPRMAQQNAPVVPPNVARPFIHQAQQAAVNSSSAARGGSCITDDAFCERVEMARRNPVEVPVPSLNQGFTANASWSAQSMLVLQP